jgi:PAS domain S-box-containing protein
MKRSLPMDSSLSVPSQSNWMNEFIYSAASIFKGQINMESRKDSMVNDLSRDFPQKESGIVFTDGSGRIVKVNHSFENLLGYFSKELENRLFTDFFFQKPLVLNSKGEEAWYGLPKNGGEIPVDIRWVNFQSEEDSFVIGFILPLTDGKEVHNRSSNLRQINEHLKGRLKQKAEQLERLAEKMKQAISEFKRQTEQKNHLEVGLKKRKQLLQAMVKHFPDVNLFLLNERNDLKSLKPKGESSFISPSDFFSAELMSQLRKSFSGETIALEVSKEDKVFSILASPVKDDKGCVEYSLVIVRNISDLKILGKRIGKILGKEKELERLSVMSSLISTLSHKMRTPLSTILAAVFLLENYSHEEFNQEKDVLMGKIKRAVKAMTQLLTDLDISQRLVEENEDAGKADGVERKLSHSHPPFLHVIKNSKDTDVTHSAE